MTANKVWMGMKLGWVDPPESGEVALITDDPNTSPAGEINNDDAEKTVGD
jgi:hypothetical protein